MEKPLNVDIADGRDADLNGAMNIAIIGAFVSKPRGSGLSCSLSKDVSGLLPDSVLLCAVGESPVTERACGVSLHMAIWL